MTIGRFVGTGTSLEPKGGPAEFIQQTNQKLWEEWNKDEEEHAELGGCWRVGNEKGLGFQLGYLKERLRTPKRQDSI